MENYKTIADTAAQWNVSPRHVQYLCKEGKIEGALKKAGAWFIPSDTPVMVKNTKSGVKDYKFVGTKNKIFETAIELFKDKGFENVSVRDIAARVGIRQSAVYNHFKSKQHILDTIYDFYECQFVINCPAVRDLEPTLKTGSLLDIILSVVYGFNGEYAQKMYDISIIIMQRLSTDERAGQIHASLLIDSGVSFVERVFDRAVELGRIAPLDTKLMATFINGVRLFTFHKWLIDPSHELMSKLMERETEIYKYATVFLTDLNPPADTAAAQGISQ